MTSKTGVERVQATRRRRKYNLVAVEVKSRGIVIDIHESRLEDLLALEWKENDYSSNH